MTSQSEKSGGQFPYKNYHIQAYSSLYPDLPAQAHDMTKT